MDGYIPKEIRFDDDARDKIISGINKIEKAVGSTLGARGRTVIIESPNHTHGITVTKDGVTVAKSIELIDPVENIGVRVVREAAERTAADAGDGTTSSIVLAKALIDAGIKHIKPEHNVTEVLKYMHEVSDEIVENLRKQSRKVGKRILTDVATISTNNDRRIGKIVADAYRKVGFDGVVSVENSPSEKTYASVTTGIKFDRGWSNRMFVNDFERDEVRYNDALLLMTDVELDNILSIEGVIRYAIENKRPLIFLAPVTQRFLAAILQNVIKNKLQFAIVEPPSFGYKQEELMSDIALACGGVFFSQKAGDDLSLIKPSDLGEANHITISQRDTIIKIDEMSAEVSERVSQLKKSLANTKSQSEKKFISERIAVLSGGIGVVYAGGNTDLERKELYDRIEDAIHAVRSALEEGILPGAGKALLNAADEILSSDLPNDEMSIAKFILADGITAPFTRILLNAGIDEKEINNIEAEIEDGATYGFNVKTYEYGDLFDMGVVDPLKVTRTALQNAVSVATTVLSTNAIITIARAE